MDYRYQFDYFKHHLEGRKQIMFDLIKVSLSECFKVSG